MTDPRLGLTVTHRRYVPYGHAHYAGNLVDGAYALALFGDVATEVCIRTDGDEGLFASYADVQFKAPLRAGDVLEAGATVASQPPRSSTPRSWRSPPPVPWSSRSRHDRAAALLTVDHPSAAIALLRPRTYDL